MADEKKIATVIDDMANRTMCATTAEAAAYITRCMTEYADFAQYEMVAPGLGQNDETGALEFDPAIYTPEMRVMICLVTERSVAGPIVKGIMVTPVPTLASIIADTNGADWLAKIVDTALNAAACRPLRKKDAKASDPEVLEGIPKTLADYVTSNAGASSALLEGFEKMWREIKAAISGLSTPFRLANLSKKEFRRSLESSNYASRYYPMIEETKKGSVFAFCLDAFISEGRARGYDVSLFETWKAKRNETVIDVNEDDEAELSLDSLSAQLAKLAEPAAPAAEPAPAA